jgi:hypothetical protein
VSSVQSPTEICNMALDAVGYPASIGDMNEGTRHANVALRLYAQTRDDVLKMQDWDFAERSAAAYVSSATPAPGWTYALVWPSDCLRLRNVVPATRVTFDPRPVQFGEMNVASTSARLILSNTFPATLIYTGQVVDMTTWDVAFVEAFVAALARRFVVSLQMSFDLLKAEAAIEAQTAQALLGSQTSVPPDAVSRGGGAQQ